MLNGVYSVTQLSNKISSKSPSPLNYVFMSAKGRNEVMLWLDSLMSVSRSRKCLPGKQQDTVRFLQAATELKAAEPHKARQWRLNDCWCFDLRFAVSKCLHVGVQFIGLHQTAKASYCWNFDSLTADNVWNFTTYYVRCIMVLKRVLIVL